MGKRHDRNSKDWRSRFYEAEEEVIEGDPVSDYINEEIRAIREDCDESR